MIHVGFNSVFVALLVLAVGQPLQPAQAKDETPDFNEISALIKEHLAGANDAMLNRAAVDGLLSAFSPKVMLITNNASTSATTTLPSLNKASVFDNSIAYLRVARVGDDLTKDFDSAYRRLSSTNKIAGIVLDLRYAGGADYAAAADTAGLFVTNAQPLLNWGKGVVSSQEKTNAIQVPVAVLVNHETARAAEALAAILRETASGLILGSRTAGEAMLTRDYPLRDGGVLRIATSPVTLGNGAAISTEGVKPDIAVPVSAVDEKAYYADAYWTAPGTNRSGAGRASRPVRLNEAELVREHKLGLNPDMDAADLPPLPNSKPPPPMVKDPVLARALDLLKGLAVVRQDRF